MISTYNLLNYTKQTPIKTGNRAYMILIDSDPTLTTNFTDTTGLINSSLIQPYEHFILSIHDIVINYL